MQHKSPSKITPIKHTISHLNWLKIL